jgi:copper homeostasis protein
MIEDIRFCRKAGVYGIATGVLTSEDRIDTVLLRVLMEEAGPLQVTFHKAIDESPDPVSEFLTLKGTGVRRVLTSGGKPTALEGARNLNRMIIALPELQVVAAGRVTLENLPELSSLIRTQEFHGRKIVGSL